MKCVKLKIVLNAGVSTDERAKRYEKVCRYLLQKFLEGCEENEGFGLFEGLNGRPGRERIFDTSTKD